MGFYNILMSTFNILSLIFIYLYFFPPSAGQQDLLLNSNFSCTSITYLLRIFTQVPSWINVMVSGDITISILFPNKFKYLKQKKVISLIVACLFVAISIFNAPNLLFKIGNQIVLLSNETFEARSNNTICGSNKEILFVRYITIILLRLVFPIILAFISNAILITKLFRSRKNIHSKTSLKKEYQFALTIVMLNFAFIVTETPYIWGAVHMLIDQVKELDVVISLSTIAQTKMDYNSSFMFSTITYGSLFFVNAIFNRIFRKEIRFIVFGPEIEPSGVSSIKHIHS